MTTPDHHDLERRLRAQRPEARDEFVESLSSRVRGRRDGSARRRATLAVLLSGAILVSLVAFGGVGVASNALHASSSTVSSAVGKQSPAARGSEAVSASSAKHQYHAKVAICRAFTKWLVRYTHVTKVVWVGEGKNRHQVTKVTKVRVRTPTTAYVQLDVQTIRVPILVAKGSVYPVPSGGCSGIGIPG